MVVKRRRLQVTSGGDQGDRGGRASARTWLFWEWHIPPIVWLPTVTVVVAFFLLNGASFPSHVLNFNPISTNVTHPTTQDVASATGRPLSHYEWVPGTPAKIDDPVDDSKYPYRIMSALKPNPTRLDGRDIAPLELRHRKRTNSTVRVFIVDDLLSNGESDVMRLIHDRHVQAMSRDDPIVCFDGPETLRYHLRDLGHDMPVLPSMFTPGTRCVNASFSSQLRGWGLGWSHGTGFHLGESDFAEELARRFHRVLGLSPENGGAFRIVSYTTNSGYKQHTDCARDGYRGTEDRGATVLVYLDDVAMGGHTYFPELGISVKPKKGRALVWNNMTPAGRCDPTSLHAAQPVLSGTKYILQRWYYYQNYPGVEKRPPIPPSPPRRPGQALVSCDEYKNGSCRWYDVWTYDVLTSY